MKTSKTKKPQTPVDVKGIQTLLNQRDISQRQLAFKVRLQPAAMSLLVRGKRRIRLDEAKTIADTLEVPLRTITDLFGIDMGPLDTMGKTRTVTVEGFLDENLVARPADHPPGLKGQRKVLCGFQERDVRALRIQSAGLAQAIDGALVFYTPSNSFEPESVGRMNLVKVLGKAELRFRIIRAGTSRGLYVLETMGGKTMEEDVKVESASPVLGIQF